MRPSGFKRGGGFLNGVDATITGYSFLVGEPATIKKGDRKGEMFTPLSLVPTFREDDAENEVSQRLLIGDADNFGDVSEDGLTLDLGTGRVSAYCEAAIFVDSLVNPVSGGDGFPGDRFDEDPTSWNLVPMVNTRVHLIQEINADKTKRQGKQKGKDGKEYDRKDLKVSAVLVVPEITAKSAKAPVKGAKATKAAKGPDVSGLALDTLKDILNSNGDYIALAKLKMKVFAAFGAKHPQRDQRDAVITFLANADNINSLDGVETDGTTVSIAA